MDYQKTTVLLSMAQDGDPGAREELYRRIMPRLERFAHGRVPVSLRNVTDTQEIVQDTMVRSLDRLEAFVPRGEGAFLQYLGKIVVNRIRDHGRRSGRQKPMEDENVYVSHREPSPVEHAVGSETFRRYQKALETLKDDQHQAVFLHVEMGYSHHDLAEALGRGSEAARKLLCRGLQNLAAQMRIEKDA